MKVLVTGSTAQQASKLHAERTPTFANLLVRTFQSAGVDATHMDPNIHWDEDFLKEFDLVVVGIAPTTSITANKIYPAFITAEKARKLGNLSLMIDAPESFKIPPSLRAWADSDTTFKSFYDKRKNYLDVVENTELRAQVEGFVSYLSQEEWPTTFYPTFPWSDKKTLVKNLPSLREENLVGVSVDSYVLLQPPKIKNLYSTEEEYWTCDSMNPYGKNEAKKLIKKVVPTKEAAMESENQTLIRIRESIGTLIATYRNNESWWSPVLSQSLSQGVPVCHDWKYTGYLGEEWSHLATTIETMNITERDELAYTQKQSYLSRLPHQDEINEDILKTIKQLV
jgi:hypothetical protein